MQDQPHNTTFVTTVDIAMSSKIMEDLSSQGFEITKPTYTQFSAKKKGVSCTLYTSGKLTVQGKEMNAFIEFYLEPEILKTFNYNYKTKEPDRDVDLSGRIGIDESGKGDFFGPLCIAGVFADGEAICNLKSLGVCDSKKLSDTAIAKIAKAISNQYPHYIVKINPFKYNELIAQFKNLNHLLAWGHATVIAHLSHETGCKKIIVDQFGNESLVLNALKRKNVELDVSQRHRAEEDLVVAAASILARFAFVEGLKSLEKQYGMILPKGASKMTIQAGKDFVSRHGLKSLEQVGKMHFKTLDSITN